MTSNRSSVSPPSTAARRCPAQHAVSEFLVIHRGGGRSAGERIFGRSPLDERSAGRYWDAVGALEVAVNLDRLGSEWSVVHGIPGVASADESQPSLIDHLVIGAAGVFSVTTYNHTRQNVWVSKRAFVVDGHSVQHIRRAEAAVGHVERMLEAAVGRHVRATTIIAVIQAGSLRVRDLPRDVFVVDAASLESWLRTRGPELAPESVAEFAAAARLDATWTDAAPSPIDSAETAGERAEFERVRRDIATARMVRIAWATGTVVVLVGALVALSILRLAAA
jgi:hypothetical protein